MRNFKMMATKDLSSGEVLEYIGVASTNIVLLSEKGKGILLVRQYRPIFSQFTLEVPGGGAEENESPKQAAIREVREETGILLSDAKFISTVGLSMGTSDEVVNIFSANEKHILRNTGVVEDGVHLVWVPDHLAKDVILSEKLVDAKSLLAVNFFLEAKSN